MRGQHARDVRVQPVHVARVQDELGEVAAHLADPVREQPLAPVLDRNPRVAHDLGRRVREEVALRNQVEELLDRGRRDPRFRELLGGR